MKNIKREYLIYGGVGIVVVGIILLITLNYQWVKNIMGGESNQESGIVISEDSLDALSEDEEVEDMKGEAEVASPVPKEYFDLLAEAREFAGEGLYSEALKKVSDAAELHSSVDVPLTRYAIHDFSGNLQGKKEAMHEIIYTFGVIDSRYWREYIQAVAQLGGTPTEIQSLYEESISSIKPVASTVGIGHLVDMYTGYAGFLGGNDKYAEAILNLELAKSLDPERGNIYDSEIAYLRTKM